jgi:hypothetical protein
MHFILCKHGVNRTTVCLHNFALLADGLRGSKHDEMLKTAMYFTLPRWEKPSKKESSQTPCPRLA